MQPRQSDIDHLAWMKLARLPGLEKLRVLDLGCGSGYLCHQAMTKGASKAVGIDLVEPENPTASWEFRKADLDSPHWHQTLNGPFDLVLAFDIVEHLASPFNFLRSCRELLSEKGQLVLTTPNALSWERFYRPASWSGVRDPQHKVLFTQYSLRFLLQRTGFASIKLRAPIRSLAFLGPLQPNIGGQMLAVAHPNHFR